jgi:hypothetical protein
MPLREEPWGERLFQMTDPNGVVIQLVEWAAPEHPTDQNEDAAMSGLTAPSRGSAELSAWAVAMEAGATA